MGVQAAIRTSPPDERRRKYIEERIILNQRFNKENGKTERSIDTMEAVGWTKGSSVEEKGVGKQRFAKRSVSMSGNCDCDVRDPPARHGGAADVPRGAPDAGRE